MYWVYKIEIENKVRYIGYTDDLIRREKQHNYLCFNLGKKKRLYDNIKKYNSSTKTIILKPIKSFSSKIEAKRWECYLILHDYFNNKNLWQQIPKIKDM